MKIKRKHATPIVLCVMLISCCVTYFTTLVCREEYLQNSDNICEFPFTTSKFIMNLIVNKTLLLILLYLILSIIVSLWCLRPKENDITKFLWIITGYLIFSFIVNFHNIRMIYYSCFEIYHLLG